MFGGTPAGASWPGVVLRRLDKRRILRVRYFKPTDRKSAGNSYCAARPLWAARLTAIGTHCELARRHDH
jgi:hypothetical protein